MVISSGFLRHIRACNNARLDERLPFRVSGDVVGWVRPEFAAVLAACPEVQRDGGGVALTEPATLTELARRLADGGHFRWRDEEFDVRADPDGPVLARIDRGALPSFGVAAEGVHVNGLVRRGGRLHLWVARRAADKQLDPGKLDHIVAGGVPAGLTPAETLVKEAEEEAAIPAELARQARPVALICYALERFEGLRRDRLHCYDLDLPEAFRPRAVDGEVEAFELWPIGRVMQTVRDTDEFKFNVNLVLIDLFLREGLVVGAEAAELRAGLESGAT